MLSRHPPWLWQALATAAEACGNCGAEVPGIHRRHSCQSRSVEAGCSPTSDRGVRGVSGAAELEGAWGSQLPVWPFLPRPLAQPPSPSTNPRTPEGAMMQGRPHKVVRTRHYRARFALEPKSQRRVGSTLDLNESACWPRLPCVWVISFCVHLCFLRGERSPPLG